MAGLAGHQEPRGNAPALVRIAGLRLVLALRVDDLREVRATTVAVHQRELLRSVQRSEPEAAWAAHPAGERCDGHPDAGPRVVRRLWVPRRAAQGSHRVADDPTDLLQQPRLQDHLLSLGTPRIEPAHDDAHGWQVDHGAHAGRRDEVARPDLSDAGGIAAGAAGAAGAGHRAVSSAA